MADNIKNSLKIEDIKLLLMNVYDNYEYINEFGYVGFYDITKEDVIDSGNRIIKLLKELEEETNKLCSNIKETFEY